MKLSQLTPEQKARLLAELDGKRPIERDYPHPFEDGNIQLTAWVRISDGGQTFCPKYLTSYDAIIPLVQKLSKENQTFMDKFCDYLIYNTKTPNGLYQESPSQICDAVLVATGKAEL